MFPIIEPGENPWDDPQLVSRALIFHYYCLWAATEHPDWDNEQTMRHWDNQNWRLVTESGRRGVFGDGWQTRLHERLGID